MLTIDKTLRQPPTSNTHTLWIKSQIKKSYRRMSSNVSKKTSNTKDDGTKKCFLVYCYNCTSSEMKTDRPGSTSRGGRSKREEQLNVEYLLENVEVWTWRRDELSSRVMRQGQDRKRPRRLFEGKECWCTATTHRLTTGEHQRRLNQVLYSRGTRRLNKDEPNERVLQIYIGSGFLRLF